MAEIKNPILEHVRKFAPSRYAKIENPEEFFAEKLEELEDMEMTVLDALDKGVWTPTDEDRADPVAMLGRRRARISQATEIAWQRVVLDEYPPEVDEVGNPLETDEAQQMELQPNPE